MDASTFIAALPKTELHLHLVGSATPDTVLELARRHPESAVPTDPEQLRAFYEFTDFAHFIDTYIKVDDLVRTPADIETLLVGLACDAARSNVRYAEVTVTIAAHLQKGMTAEQVSVALAAGRCRAQQEHGVMLNWIFDIPAGLGAQAVPLTMDFVLLHRPEGTVALGLAGMEAGFPRADYAPQFRAARDAGLHVVAHAGETTGAEEVAAALDVLGAERIGHGIGAATDPALLRRLAQRGVPLEICPTSNLRTKAVVEPEAHPIATLLEHGVTVTLSTDDPGMFHCELDGEYALVAARAGLDNAALARIARDGFAAAYCPPELRATAHAEIDALLQQTA